MISQTSISSEAFKSLHEAQRLGEEQASYKKSHFTVKDKESLKKDYEDFFSTTEEISKPPNNDSLCLRTVIEEEKQNIVTQKDNDGYDYYEEDDNANK